MIVDDIAVPACPPAVSARVTVHSLEIIDRPTVRRMKRQPHLGELQSRQVPGAQCQQLSDCLAISTTRQMPGSEERVELPRQVVGDMVHMAESSGKVRDECRQVLQPAQSGSEPAQWNTSHAFRGQGFHVVDGPTQLGHGHGDVPARGREPE